MTNWEGKQAVYRDNEPNTDCDDQNHLDSHGLKPSLKAIAENDKDRWESFERLTHDLLRQIQLLRDPLKAWAKITAKMTKGPRSSLENCKLRQRADDEINIDEQGMMEVKKIELAFENIQIIDNDHRTHWFEETSVRSVVYHCFPLTNERRVVIHAEKKILHAKETRRGHVTCVSPTAPNVNTHSQSSTAIRIHQLLR